MLWDLALRPSELEYAPTEHELRDSTLTLIRIMVKSSSAGLQQTWVQFLAGPLYSCGSPEPRLSLRCFICKMGVITAPTSWGVVRIKPVMPTYYLSERPSQTMPV